MTTEPTIREQSYHYFLQEAPELLQVLEQELLSLREDYSINKIHTLMRTTHTLKGAAASVGLETIKTVAHSLEDIFKALFNPDLSIDPEVEALLFEGYECLYLPIAAEVTGVKANDAEILDRTAAVFAQLQEKLGDCFDQTAQIPSSVELGFDVTQSIFEVGVTQRLDEIATAIASANPAAIDTTLRTQAGVFEGLAESLGLPGFEAIAQAAIAALDAHPELVVSIGQIALADFQAGQAAVLDGDRTQGGQPSLALQELADLFASSTALTQEEWESGRGGEGESGRTPQLKRN